MLKTSVLINNFNNAHFLHECVESALNQSLPASEVIVYDDGSTDGSVSILRGFGNRITLIEGARSSLSSRASQANAIYQSFRASSGELVFLLDGDDRFHRGKIEAYVEAYLGRPDVSFVQSPLQQIDGQGVVMGNNYQGIKHQADYLQATYRFHDVDFYYPTSAMALSRTFLEKILPLDFSDGIELPADTRIGMLAPFFGKVVTLDRSYADWRRHAQAYTARKFERTAQLKQTLRRYRVFNRYCRDHKLRGIHLWRNRRFYLQLLRVGTPTFLYDIYYRQTLRPTINRTRLPNA